MADDSREPKTVNGADTASPALVAYTVAGDAPKKGPRGLILGKDGKPCRSCNSFAAFTSSSKSALKAHTGTTPTAAPADCPPDVVQLGRSSWTLLHSIAATYPEQPTPVEQNDVKSFMQLFAKLYPCWVCAEDFQKYIRKEEIRTTSRDDFGTWLCEAHNEVNRKLGKPAFDCSRWQERWRTGWKDGRCD